MAGSADEEESLGYPVQELPPGWPYDNVESSKKSSIKPPSTVKSPSKESTIISIKPSSVKPSTTVVANSSKSSSSSSTAVKTESVESIVESFLESILESISDGPSHMLHPLDSDLRRRRASRPPVDIAAPHIKRVYTTAKICSLMDSDLEIDINGIEERESKQYFLKSLARDIITVELKKMRGELIRNCQPKHVVIDNTEAALRKRIGTTFDEKLPLDLFAGINLSKGQCTHPPKKKRPPPKRGMCFGGGGGGVEVDESESLHEIECLPFTSQQACIFLIGGVLFWWHIVILANLTEKSWGC